MNRDEMRDEIDLLIGLEKNLGLSDYGKGCLDTYVKIYNKEFMWDTDESIYDRIKKEKGIS
jgi:hypothetical protein